MDDFFKTDEPSGPALVIRNLTPDIYRYLARYYKRGEADKRDKLISEALREYFRNRGYQIEFNTGRLIEHPGPAACTPSTINFTKQTLEQ